MNIQHVTFVALFCRHRVVSVLTANYSKLVSARVAQYIPLGTFSTPLVGLLGRLRQEHSSADGVSTLLPSHLRSSSISRGQFRAGLKTHLFTQAYTDTSENFC